MIKHFYIDNFKSLVDFRLSPEGGSLAKFTCLVGLNGAGKSTVLQALDFIGHLASG
ncbi:MAG: AAA family ATPase, partial [Aquimonas sp.]